MDTDCGDSPTSSGEAAATETIGLLLLDSLATTATVARRVHSALAELLESASEDVLGRVTFSATIVALTHLAYLNRRLGERLGRLDRVAEQIRETT